MGRHSLGRTWSAVGTQISIASKRQSFSKFVRTVHFNLQFNLKPNVKEAS
jgi:hypothetical protein